MTDQVAIHTEGLTKHYGDVKALIDLDLSVERGEIFGFLGPNGAGKTTMIRTILDEIRPDFAGTASIAGSGLPLGRRSRSETTSGMCPVTWRCIPTSPDGTPSPISPTCGAVSTGLTSTNSLIVSMRICRRR